jgi:hypothetical protein
MIASRDVSRRQLNLLCKPLSEFDLQHFKRETFSYYEIGDKIPKPICGGRFEFEWKALY